MLYEDVGKVLTFPASYFVSGGFLTRGRASRVQVRTQPPLLLPPTSNGAPGSVDSILLTSLKSAQFLPISVYSLLHNKNDLARLQI